MTEQNHRQAVIEAVCQALRAGRIDSYEDLADVINGKLDELGITGARTRGGLFNSVKADVRVRDFLLGLRQRECEQYRPITELSPVEHLPLDPRAYNLLKRAYLKTIGDILRKEEEDGLVAIRNFGPEALKEVLAALCWAQPIVEEWQARLQQLQADLVAFRTGEPSNIDSLIAAWHAVDEIQVILAERPDEYLAVAWLPTQRAAVAVADLIGALRELDQALEATLEE